MRYRIDRFVVLNQIKIKMDMCTYTLNHSGVDYTLLPRNCYRVHYKLFNAQQL